VLLRQVWSHRPKKEGVMRPGASRKWENKSFFDQNKNKRNFQRRLNKQDYNILQHKNLFNYYKTQEKPIIINSQPWNTIFKSNLITTRPQAPRQKPKES
jgi:hypothetical protein